MQGLQLASGSQGGGVDILCLLVPCKRVGHGFGLGQGWVRPFMSPLQAAYFFLSPNSPWSNDLPMVMLKHSESEL